MKTNKTFLTMGIALLLTLIGVGLSYSFIQDSIQNHLSTVQQPVQQVQPEYVEVTVLNTYLNRGSIVEKDALDVRKIPLSEMSQAIIPFQNADYLVGKTLKMNVPPGIPLAYSLVQVSNALVLSDLLKPGEKALTLPLTLLNSFHGFIQPGDFVDFLATIKINEKNQTIPLLDSIEVLATDTYFRQGYTEEGLPNTEELKTMTVKVTNEQAQKITYAHNEGQLVTLLRNSKDTQKQNHHITQQEHIVPKKHEVQFIIGKKK